MLCDYKLLFWTRRDIERERDRIDRLILQLIHGLTVGRVPNGLRFFIVIVNRLTTTIALVYLMQGDLHSLSLEKHVSILTPLQL